MILFHISAIIFIWTSLYYLLNWERLDKRFKDRDENSKKDLIYYITKLLFWPWLIVGCFTYFKYLYLSMILISLIRIPIFHINKRLSTIIYRITPPINIIILILIIIYSIKH
jgi:hypothetical protein